VVHLPALRQRPEDIPELAEHFAVKMCRELGWPLFAGFDPAAMHALQDHDWPGNVRELKNVVERSLHRWGIPDQPVAEVVIDPFESPYADAGEGPDAKPLSRESRPAEIAPDFNGRMRAIERRLVLEALEEHGYSQRRTAEALGLSYDQLRGLVRKHGLSRRRRKSLQEPDAAA
jgi:psp operon transcriptional activator